MHEGIQKILGVFVRKVSLSSICYIWRYIVFSLNNANITSNNSGNKSLKVVDAYKPYILIVN